MEPLTWVAAPLVTRWPVHGEDEVAAVARVLESGRTNMWSAGDAGEVMNFECEWSRMLGLPHALAVSNGTTALEAALRGVGFDEVCRDELRFRDTVPEVIVPCRTFMATASCVFHAGGKPVLADIDAGSLCVTAETLEERRTERTQGVIVVHYAGLPCPDMPEIMRWAMKHGLWVIEDCAHAHGAHVGRMGAVAAWSFCVGKIMSTGGEGGMVACLDDGVAERMGRYRDHGRYQMTGKTADTSAVGGSFRWTVGEFGSNARMIEIQGAIGRVQLRKLDEWLRRRREIAARYDLVFDAVPQPESARYMYIGQVQNRDSVMAELNARSIPARIGGCPNIGYEEAFTKRDWVWENPVADAVGEKTLMLPVYPTMTSEEVDRVCREVSAVI